MTKQETILLPTIGLTHIDTIPVVDNNFGIILYDMYTKAGEWLGSKRTLKQCITFNKELRKIEVAKEIKV